MADVKNKRVNIYIDQASAEDALVKLQSKADGFNNKIQKCREQQTKLLDEIKKSEAAGKDVTNLQNKYDRLTTQINATNKSIKDNTDAQAKLKQQIDSGIAPSFNQLSRYVSNLHNELKNLSQDAPEYAAKFESFRTASAQLNGLRDSMSLVEKAQKSLFSQAPAIAFGVLIGNTVQGIAESLMGYLGSFVSFKSEFQNSIANLSAITGATGNDLDFLKGKAIEFSKTGVRSAKDYVEAFKLVASAKPELLQQKEALADVTKQAALLADAAGIELPDAATRLTDALNQFGAPAEQAGLYVDALAAASKYGAAEVPQVTEALLQFGAQAKSSNVNIYESSALIELLAEKGIKGAEAGTKLRNVLLRLNAVDALPKEAIDALNDAGVNMGILSNKSLSLEVRLRELSKIQNDATALVKVFGEVNFNAGQIVLQNVDRYKQLADQVTEVGVASQQAQVNTNTLSNNWERLKNIIGSKFLGGFTDEMNSLVKGTIQLIQPTKDLDAEFRDLKASTDDFNKKLDPLVARYDELKGKTTLNKDEQVELNNIIHKIVEIMPQAVGEVDKYGKALDINRKAVKDFREENDKFVRDSQAKTIDKLQAQAKAIAREIDLSVHNLDELKKQYAKYNTPIAEQKGLKVETTAMAVAQKALIELNDKLENQYKTKLPDALQKYLESARIAAFGTADKPAAAVISNTGETDEEKNARLLRDAERNKKAQEKELKEQEELLKKLKDFKFELEQVGKKADESEIARIEKKYKTLMDEATKHSLSLIGLEDEKNRAIAFLIDKEQKRLKAEAAKFQKEEQEEYLVNVINGIDANTQAENDKLRQSYIDRKISKEKLLEEERKLDIDALEFKILNLENISKNEDINDEVRKKAATQLAAFRKQLNKERLDDGIKTTDQLVESEKKANERIYRDKKAGADLKVLTAKNADERLIAQQAVLKLEMDHELANVDLTENEKALIREKYRQAEAKLKKEKFLAEVNEILSFAAEASNVLEKFNQARNNREKAALDKELKANDERRKSVQNLIKNKLVSEVEGRRQLNALDIEDQKKKDDLEKKQNERNKRFARVQAIINGAQAVTKAASEFPFPLNLIPIAFAVATTAAQIATIDSQKFGKGGKLTGPSHSAGGMPVINPNTGQKEAEVEGGEYILSKDTVANNRMLADALLRSSMYNNGRTITYAPAWQTRPYQSINFSGITQSIQQLKFATGGIFGNNATNTQAAPSIDLTPFIAAMENNQQVVYAAMNTIAKLNQRLNEPITADVSLFQIDKVRNDKANMLKEASPS